MDVWVISMLLLVMIKKCFAVQLILKKQPSLLDLAPRNVSLYSDEEQEETAVYAGCCLVIILHTTQVTKRIRDGKG